MIRIIMLENAKANKHTPKKTKDAGRKPKYHESDMANF